MDTAALRTTATFGRFTLIPAQLLLLDGDTPVRLGSRAMALLCALVEQAGAVLSRDELVARVWPETVVEETSLRVQVAALRKALGEGQRGDRYVVNVIGRGYSFVAPVSWQPGAPAPVAADDAPRRHNLPARLARMVGRDEVVKALRAQVGRRRLVSIVGPGGIGKTAVSLSVAEAACEDFEHGARFVDLAPLSDPGAVEAALSAALAVTGPAGDALPTLHAFLRERELLLVFDNCEHVVEPVARLCEALLREAPRLHILTTSREALNAESEWVHRLAALRTPEPADALGVEQALEYPAVLLFVERAMANADSFVLAEGNLHWVRQVCGRLDGMPLAIELAAARIASLGVQGLAARLEDVFDLLTRGRRTGEPRHHAMKAVLAWSHDLLSDDERKVLRRLAIFRATFTLEAARSVAADDQMDGGAVVEHLLSLCDKSLVTVAQVGELTLYRLLYTTRKFAEAQLAALGETDRLLHRHARYFHDELVARRADPAAMGSASFLAFFEHTFEDTSAAIEWAFVQPATRDMGLQLALRCNLYDVGHLDPQMVRFERISGHVLALDPPQPELVMQTCHNWCRLSGMSNAFALPQERMFASLRAAMAGALPDHRAVCLHSMSIGAFGQGNYRGSIDLAEELANLGDQPMAARQAERLLALNHHFMGRHQEARGLTQALVDEVLTTARAPNFQSAQRSFPMRLVMARLLWMQGHVDQAAAMAEAALADSVQAYPFARCKALGLAVVPVALWRGDLEAAESANRRLRDIAARHSLGYWRAWVDNFDRIIRARRSGEPVRLALEGELARCLPARNPTEMDALPTFAEELLSEQALARVLQGDVGWCAPETLRVHGMRVWRAGAQGAEAEAEAEALFERSLQMARAQGALSWELRTACSLARLWNQKGRSVDAKALLGATCVRFQEGHQTADLIAARVLLDEMDAA